jgi:hypothetical protein
LETNELIKNFDPNVRWGRKKVEVILQQWEYRKTFIMEHGGNTVGYSNLECAVHQLLETLETKKMLGDNGLEDVPFLIMTDAEGNECEFEPDEENPNRWDSWIERMVVSVKLIEVTPEQP